MRPQVPRPSEMTQMHLPLLQVPAHVVPDDTQAELVRALGTCRCDCSDTGRCGVG